MYFLLRFLLSLRYRVTFLGLDSLVKKRPGGFLFLPNHVAHTDPLVLLAWLMPRFSLRPVVVEFIYRLPGVGFFLRKLRAFPMPDFETSVNQYKTYKAEQGLIAVATALKKGDNILLYPSGKLKKSGLESLQGNAGLSHLLTLCPEANVVLVRTKGFWGSSFSKALEGSSPDPKKTLLKGIKILLKNALFFAPRRSIRIECISEPTDWPSEANRIELNQYLENWYNREGPEPLQLVPSSFWDPTLPKVHHREAPTTPVSSISNATRSKLYAEIRQILDRPELKISPEMRFATDLGMDSLNLAEFIAYLGQTYDLGPLHPDQFDTVQDALLLIEGTKKRPIPVAQRGLSWPEEHNRPPVQCYPGKTLPEVFLNTCKTLSPFAAAADDTAGVISYRKAKQAILVLAEHFRMWPEVHVAILLPASVGAYLVYFALLFAGKVPVMLNWTLGPRYLEEMMRMSQAKRVLTSWRFLEKVSDVDFGAVVKQLELLEDIRAALTFSQKLQGALLARLPSRFVLSKLSDDENQIATLFFTSGTEASPKGVPLSHKNILSNQRSAVPTVGLAAKEIFYGILPPFHSFGCLVNGILPLCVGARIAYFPDPTDSYSLAAGIQKWAVTCLVLSPTFFKRLIQVAKPEQLQSLRLIIMGAEKVSSELYDLWKRLHLPAAIMEGYGATECSPIISTTPYGLAEKLGKLPDGVGRLLPIYSARTIHPETGEPLPEGKEGEICVRAPSVFSGYLGNTHSPFIELDGQQWYRTGDIGWIDRERTVYLTDRLKRFAKIGGEMISLRAVEETLFHALLKLGKISAEGASLAICADERSLDQQQLVLFTTVELDKEELNQLLLASGFSRLVKISAIRHIKEIPLMATGKINYRHLKEGI